jgi:hypothetical protein
MLERVHALEVEYNRGLLAALGGARSADEPPLVA